MKNLKSIDIPNSPGVYKFLNSDNKILYVGKSKNLKKRVKSYFQKEQNKKISNLVKETTKIDFIISESEHDALLLENNLIKENKPKYNILLRDDKTFPYIAISKDRFPKIYTTRKINHQKEEVFGPYTNVKSMRSILKLIKNLYKIRNCNYVLSKENIDNKKFKVCLEYHLGNCKGPCEDKQKETEYENDISEIRNILKGRTIELTNSLKKEMSDFSQDLNFEKAQEIKDKILNPVWHVHNGNIPKENNIMSFSMLLNLVETSNADSKDLLWKFVKKYKTNLNEKEFPIFDKLVDYAIKYYKDVISPNKKYKTPNSDEKKVLMSLVKALDECNDKMTPEDIQTKIFSVGKENGYKDNLRDWFKLIYEVVFGDENGPRIGFFISFFGVKETQNLIKEKIM